MALESIEATPPTVLVRFAHGLTRDLFVDDDDLGFIDARFEAEGASC
jgi:hypothetical protein